MTPAGPGVVSPIPSATSPPAEATPAPSSTVVQAQGFRFSFGAGLPPDERGLIVAALGKIAEFFRVSGVPPIGSVDVYAYMDAEELARVYDRPGGRPASDVEQQLQHHAAQARYRTMLINSGADGWHDASDVQKLRILAHEYAHVIQLDLMGQTLADSLLLTPPTLVHAGGPAWLFEGVAELLGRLLVDDVDLSEFDTWLADQRALAARRPLSLVRLESYLDFAAEGEFAAAHGAIAADELLERSSLNGLLGMWLLIGRGLSWDAAFVTAFGLTPVQFNSAFELARQAGFR